MDSGSDTPRAPLPPRVVPVYVPPMPPPPGGSGLGRVLLIMVLLGSLALNVLLICGGYFLRSLTASDTESANLRERVVAGSPSAADKVAIVRIDGTIIETQLGFAHRQIEDAQDDDAVKAVVVRIDSPGGTITASDDLYRRLVRLRDGSPAQSPHGKSPRKPLVVSMGSLAASGGYYVAMPASEPFDVAAKKIFAERTTITGSIGVYAAFPNVEDLARKNGVSLEMIRAGDVKGSGSLFYRMTPQERQPWADMVSHAYQQFIEVVELGRPKLQGRLTAELFPPKTIPVVDDRGNPVKDEGGQVKTTTYTRKLADGGIFTADEALQWGLIDAIGTLEDAAAEAARQAQLRTYRVIRYERPPTLMSLLIGSSSARAPNFGRLAGVLSPRLWYLAPGAELSALMNAAAGDSH